MSESDEHIQQPPDPGQFDIPEHSFVDRYGIHPLLFAFMSLAAIFLLYQVGGGILTLLVTGVSSVTRDNVWPIRWITMTGQICFILVPTLLLARLFSVRIRDVFPFRIPGLRESTLALISLFSLQRVFEGYMYFQEQIPMPQLLRDIVEPMKKMLEELTKVLLQAESPWELAAVLLVVAIVPAVVEELLFRGLIQKTFERLMSPIVSAVLAGTIFGLFHFNPFEIVPLVGLGVFFGLLRYRSHSLLLPIAAHFFNNLMAVLATYYGLQDDNLMAAAQKTSSAPVIIVDLLFFAAIFVFSFVLYLRMTHDSSRQGYS
jgi:membrane protease YdiL (CAAX protease family)